MHALIKAHREQLLSLARHRGVTDVRVFGSMVRGGERGDSEVDLRLVQDAVIRNLHTLTESIRICQLWPWHSRAWSPALAQRIDAGTVGQ